MILSSLVVQRIFGYGPSYAATSGPYGSSGTGRTELVTVP